MVIEHLTKRAYAVMQVLCRGVGQVIFQENALSGAIMLVGLFVTSAYVGLYALVGTMLATLTAYVLGYPREDIRRGLYGFNGTLVGIAVACFCMQGWGSVAILLFASGLSTYVARLMARQSLVPGLTAPFVLLGWAILLLVKSFPKLAVQAMAGSEWGDSLDIVRVMSLSFGQIMLQGESVLTGGLFLVAIACNSWRMALGALVASVLSLGAMCLPSVSTEAINSGLYGYNSILSFLAVASVLPIKRWRYTKAFFALGIAILLQYLGLCWSIPTLTAPFVLSVWLIALSEGTWRQA